jgi:hypothetical protein
MCCLFLPDKFADTYGANGTKRGTRLRILSFCQVLCLRDKTCGGIDWDRNQSTCYTYGLNKECAISLVSNASFDHYRLKSICQSKYGLHYVERQYLQFVAMGNLLWDGAS